VLNLLYLHWGLVSQNISISGRADIASGVVKGPQGTSSVNDLRGKGSVAGVKGSGSSGGIGGGGGTRVSGSGRSC